MKFDFKLVNSNKQFKEISSNEFNSIEEIFKYKAWKNDHIIMQLLVYANEESTINLEIEKVEEIDFKIYAVQKVLAYTGKPFEPIPYKENIKRTEASDLLIETNQIKLNKGETSSFFIDIHTKNAKDSKVNIVISDGEKSVNKELELKIIDKFVEINKEIFDIHVWQYPYSSAEYYEVEPFSDSHVEILKKHLEPYKKLGGDAIVASLCEDAWGDQTYSKNKTKFPSMIKWKLEEEMKYDFSDFDKWIEITNDLGLGQKRIILYGMAPWHESFTYIKDGELVREKYDIKSKLYFDRWIHFLEHLYRHLEDKNIHEKVFIGIDEMGFNDEIFEIIEKASNKLNINIKVAAAINDFENTKKYGEYIEYASVSFIEYEKDRNKFIDFTNERRRQNKYTSLYSCTGHKPGNFVLSQFGETYITVVQSFITDGFLRWAYDAWVKDPLVDVTHEFFEPGDCFLIYPALKNREKPNISIRYLKILEAIYDGYKLRSILNEEELFDFFRSLGTKFVWSNTYPTDEETDLLFEDIEKIKEIINIGDNREA